jgi:hypothetical protein
VGTEEARRGRGKEAQTLRPRRRPTASWAGSGTPTRGTRRRTPGGGTAAPRPRPAAAAAAARRIPCIDAHTESPDSAVGKKIKSEASQIRPKLPIKKIRPKPHLSWVVRMAEAAPAGRGAREHATFRVVRRGRTGRAAAVGTARRSEMDMPSGLISSELYSPVAMMRCGVRCWLGGCLWKCVWPSRAGRGRE